MEEQKDKAVHDLNQSIEILRGRQKSLEDIIVELKEERKLLEKEIFYLKGILCTKKEKYVEKLKKSTTRGG